MEPIICARCQAMPKDPDDYLCNGCRVVLTEHPPSLGEALDHFKVTVRLRAERDLCRLARLVGLRR